MHVLFLAAEADPFVKVGGLGDVANALPRALRNLPATWSTPCRALCETCPPRRAAIPSWT
ncbi:MAG: hypothetical protein DWB59_12720 [Anaerolineae bacterium]|nr:hypothetical protein [Anaerolineae bacterium]